MIKCFCDRCGVEICLCKRYQFASSEKLPEAIPAELPAVIPEEFEYEKSFKLKIEIRSNFEEEEAHLCDNCAARIVRRLYLPLGNIQTGGTNEDAKSLNEQSSQT